jgi:hypothetical protein
MAGPQPQHQSSIPKCGHRVPVAVSCTSPEGVIRTRKRGAVAPRLLSHRCATHWHDVFWDSLSLTQGRPLVRVCSAGSSCAGGSRQRIRGLRYAVRPTVAEQPPWCDRISTPAENQLYPFSEHTCAHRRVLSVPACRIEE